MTSKVPIYVHTCIFKQPKTRTQVELGERVLVNTNRSYSIRYDRPSLPDRITVFPRSYAYKKRWAFIIIKTQQSEWQHGRAVLPLLTLVTWRHVSRWPPHRPRSPAPVFQPDPNAPCNNNNLKHSRLWGNRVRNENRLKLNASSTSVIRVSVSANCYSTTAAVYFRWIISALLAESMIERSLGCILLNVLQFYVPITMSYLIFRKL